MRTPTPRQAALVVDMVALLMAGSVAVAGAGLTWHILGHSGARAPVVLPAGPAAPPLDLASVHALAPFGTAVSTAATGASGDPSTLGMQLRGVVLARPAAASTALISTGSGKAVAYRAGDTLPGGALLDGIEYDLVTLRFDGRLQTLSFPARPGGGAVAGPAMPIAQVGNTPRVSPLEAYKARADTNPRALLDSLGAVATPEGYRIGDTPSADMVKAGLRPGDLIEKVNGVALGDPVKDQQVFAAAVAAGFVRVDIAREGTHMTLSFPLR